MDNREKKRILMVFPKMDRGGAEFLIQYMLEEGFSEEFEISICTICPSCDSMLEEKFRKTGVSLYSIDLSRIDIIRITFRLYRLMRRIRPHVVHTHLYPLVQCLLPSLLAGVPVRMHTVHNVAWHDGGATTRMMARIASRHLGLILVGISKTIAHTVRSYYGLEQVPVVNNGIPVDGPARCSKEIRRDTLGIGENEFVCINVASFSARKNHAMLLRSFKLALESNREMVLLLLGQGPLRPDVERLARDLGVFENVRFLGLRDDVMELLCLSDLFVMSSIFEGLPISAMEAMSAGLPVVATNVGGLADLVVDGLTGFLVEPGDEAGLASAIVRVSEDRNNSMGKAGRERIRREFSIASTVRGYEAMYRELLEERKRFDDD